ncbi:T-complex protein 11-like protein 1 [Melanotaenia boesemani]|uniref:T-complex protein 11-like protein 1 n=1 Tax=Melanotaenia boesemani TaxID=1250792 RepID=UPI001C055954|nr:T-complex protein 11-like protein 1 [Melanotaenia boesemani]XP_041835473.1 T-complex protein 11-like protein 1 [Melanotaenia boesemani]
MSNQREEVGDESPSDLPCLEKLDSPTGSPPTASLSSLMELENCVSNLSLAHEIVVNRDFFFKPGDPLVNSLEGRVTEIVHRAFWDSLQEQLSNDPPNYKHAVILLQEVKNMLLSLLLPGHVRLRSQLDEVLDMELIQQQVAHGALDIHRLAAFITDTMASLCAPVRDPEVKALRDLEDPVELLKGIFRVLGLMKTDMVNFTIQSLRPHLLQQAVQYERTKFQQILDKHPASLDKTTAWLQAAASEEAIGHQAGSPASDRRVLLSATAVLNRAYMRLLHWDPQDQKYPETVLMDRARLDTLSQQLQMLVLEASVLLLTSTQFRSVIFHLQGFVGKLRQSITALLESSHTREADLKRALLGIGDMVLKQMTDAVSTQGGGALPQESQDVLRRQISDLWKQNNAVRTLIGERVQDFLLAMLQGGPAKRSPELHFPLGLVSAELAELGTAFGRIVHFNRTVFGPFYAPILRKLLLPTGEAEAGEDLR